MAAASIVKEFLLQSPPGEISTVATGARAALRKSPAALIRHCCRLCLLHLSHMPRAPRRYIHNPWQLVGPGLGCGRHVSRAQHRPDARRHAAWQLRQGAGPQPLRGPYGWRREGRSSAARQVLIAKAGELDESHYVDPRGRRVITFDHRTQACLVRPAGQCSPPTVRRGGDREPGAGCRARTAFRCPLSAAGGDRGPPSDGRRGGQP